MLSQEPPTPLYVLAFSLRLGADRYALQPSARAIKDAPFSVPLATIKAAITCPNGIKKKAGGIVFLVHGTGSAGADRKSVV